MSFTDFALKAVIVLADKEQKTIKGGSSDFIGIADITTM
jgi:hypothetical protein